MTTTVLLARHAAHDRLDRVLCGRMPGVSLSGEGRAQAGRLAERLARRHPTALYTSPLDRARETAAPLAARLGLDPRVAEGLAEIDVGDWTGRSFDELRGDPAWTAWNTRRSLARPPGGETMLAVQARAVGWLERARAGHGDETIALVSHADVIKAVLAHYLGLPLDQIGRFEVGPASTSTLVVGDWGAKVQALNEGGGR